MLVYTLIMFLTAAAFAGLSIAIYRGRTDLIHDYHQANVTDQAAYAKAFGKALSVFAVAPLLSGIIGLLEHLAALAVAVLITGLCIGVICIVAVQKKHNRGVF